MDPTNTAAVGTGEKTAVKGVILSLSLYIIMKKHIQDLEFSSGIGGGGGGGGGEAVNGRAVLGGGGAKLYHRLYLSAKTISTRIILHVLFIINRVTIPKVILFNLTLIPFI